MYTAHLLVGLPESCHMPTTALINVFSVAVIFSETYLFFDAKWRRQMQKCPTEKSSELHFD